MFERILLTVLLISLFAITVTAYITDAKSHSWYESECCHNEDCHKVIRVEKQENSTIYVVKDKRYGKEENDYEVRVPISEEDRLQKSRDSQDMDIHVCFDFYYLQNEEMVWIKCIYYPGAV